jgi:hypothetical protein
MRNTILTIFTLFLYTSTNATIWVVDPMGTYPTPNSVKNLVASGDTVHIKAALYKNHPQVIFRADNLLIQGIEGRPRLEGGATLAANSNGKALLVIKGKNCHIDNIEFANAKVPDNNGAGIRQEACDLLVTYCYFTGNEMGILGGNYDYCKVTIEHCSFTNNGNSKNPGFQHNIYINHIDTLLFQYNYTYDAVAEGQELKSRARNNIIQYNYIANFSSNDSRNIDLPNGGTSLIMGNIIEQGENSVNSNLVGYGLEGLSNSGTHDLWIVNNTFVNRKSKGSFVHVKDGTEKLFMKNNILVGPKTGGLILGTPLSLDSGSNWISDDVSSAKFVLSSSAKYNLGKNSPCVDAGAALTKLVNDRSLIPTLQYIDSVQYNKRHKDGMIDIGAYEYKSNTSVSAITSTNNYLYPNPLKGKILYYKSAKPQEFSIYTLEGRYVYGGVFIGGQAHVKLPPGLYILGAGGVTTRLLVE